MNAIAEHDFNHAFAVLQKASTDSIPLMVSADICLILGTLYHLKYDLKRALELYNKAVEVCRAKDLTSTNGATRESLLIEYEAKQKLAQLLSETSDLQAVCSILIHRHLIKWYV